jgi:site-specific recombinase XerD
MSIRHFSEQKRYLKIFVQFIGASTEVQKISTLALQSYRAELSKRFNTPSGLNHNLATIKSLFNWAQKNDILQAVPNISRDRLGFCDKPIPAQAVLELLPLSNGNA